jgi:hypothetical protein
VLPLSLFHFALVVCYNLLSVAGLLRPVDRWWVDLGSLQPLVYSIGYALVVGGLTLVAHWQRWDRNMRWIIEVGSRRGLAIGGIPWIDIAIILAFAATVIAVAEAAPGFVDLAVYLVLPLGMIVLVALLTSNPPELDLIMDDDRKLSEIAQRTGINPTKLAEANGLDPAVDHTILYAQEIRVPLDQ